MEAWDTFAEAESHIGRSQLGKYYKRAALCIEESCRGMINTIDGDSESETETIEILKAELKELSQKVEYNIQKINEGPLFSSDKIMYPFYRERYQLLTSMVDKSEKLIKATRSSSSLEITFYRALGKITPDLVAAMAEIKNAARFDPLTDEQTQFQQLFADFVSMPATRNDAELQMRLNMLPALQAAAAPLLAARTKAVTDDLARVLSRPGTSAGSDPMPDGQDDTRIDAQIFIERTDINLLRRLTPDQKADLLQALQASDVRGSLRQQGPSREILKKLYCAMTPDDDEGFIAAEDAAIDTWIEALEPYRSVFQQAKAAWPFMTTDQRKPFILTAMMFQAQAFGFPAGGASFVDDSEIPWLGYFDKKTKTTIINTAKDGFNIFGTAFETGFHETFHGEHYVWENELKKFGLEGARAWVRIIAYSYSHNIPPDEDITIYKRQPLERHAIRASGKMMRAFLAWLEPEREADQS